MKAARLLALYPRSWRLRYGEEIAAILGEDRLSLSLVVDLTLGAIDAHLHAPLMEAEFHPLLGDLSVGGSPKMTTRIRTALVPAIFITGILFCYFVLLPSALKSLVNFGSEVFDNQLRAADYVSFVTTLILGMFALAFAGALVFAGRARKRRLATR